MKRPPRVLLVSYYYPPMQAIGSYRLASLARHLPKHGFEPVALSVEVTKNTWHGQGIM